jgi:polyphosphate glucokinase
MLVLDHEGNAVSERRRELTPEPATPKAVLEVIARLLPEQPPFDRVAIGFPGVVVGGVARTAPNLGTDLWRGQTVEADIAHLSGRPTRVINDADLQGYGVTEGKGVELVLTLGTGLGSALFVDGRLVPNLELGHHPFQKKKTYEERISDKELKRIGPKHWTRRVLAILRQLEPIVNYDRVHLGGGNVTHLTSKLPPNARTFSSETGLRGGISIWQGAKGKAAAAVKPARRRRKPR